MVTDMSLTAGELVSSRQLRDGAPPWGRSMTYTRSPDEVDQGDDVLRAKAAAPGRRRRRRGLRVMAMSQASATVLLGATAAGAFIYVNHELGSIPRIPVKFLAQEDPAKGMTVLLSGSEVGPTGLPGI